MKDTNIEYIANLKKLKKDELAGIITKYNDLASIFNGFEFEDKKASKDNLANFLEENKYKYLKNLVMSLDLNDFETLKILLTKKCDTEYLNSNKDFINYLLDSRVIWQKDDLEITSDVKEALKKIIKEKEVVSHIKKWNSLYKFVDGIIVAYGVISRKHFETLINDLEEKDMIIQKLEFYYKKDYLIDSNKIISTKLSNKKKIDNYLKNVKYKEFTQKEFVAMGMNNYHHGIKSYKKLIKMLKSNYVFKKKDIEFVDLNIVIPYLYNSLNEEEVALKNLENIITDLFEFKGDKLKEKMLSEVKAIREEFPLWEYRGYTKVEVNHE